MTTPLPPCGLYLTRTAVGPIPADRLVYFHNHGDPGPGLYLPSAWVANRARFDANGTLLPRAEDALFLEPLAPEGFYRVKEAFHCCPQKCRLFAPELLVQLGYDGAGTPILFVPEINERGFVLPERGSRIDRDRIAHLAALQVPVTGPKDEPTVH